MPESENCDDLKMTLETKGCLKIKVLLNFQVNCAKIVEHIELVFGIGIV